ncbi:MAG: serine/threonine-protein kinase [Nitrososphaeria archaeon]
MSRNEGTRWVCKICGKTIPANYSFCTTCGAKRQLSINEGDDWFCKFCGKTNPKVYAFCINCGAKREEQASWTCEKCGKPMPSDLLEYCMYCGAKKGMKKKVLKEEIASEILPESREITPVVESSKQFYKEDEAFALLCPAGYRIIGKIGSGGFGEVFKCYDANNRVMALKFPKIKSLETVSADVFKKFLDEAKVWSKLKHPNIVEVFSYGVKPVPWIAMEFMEGGSLDEKLKYGPLKLTDALNIAIKVSDAIYFAHHHGVVHQDIKPKNILFDRQGNPKITDWGLSKVLLEESSTRPSSVHKYPALK